jgi:hypothetical protein
MGNDPKVTPSWSKDHPEEPIKGFPPFMVPEHSLPLLQNIAILSITHSPFI